jgi:hypothetical protein
MITADYIPSAGELKTISYNNGTSASLGFPPYVRLKIWQLTLIVLNIYVTNSYICWHQ